MFVESCLKCGRVVGTRSGLGSLESGCKTTWCRQVSSGGCDHHDEVFGRVGFGRLGSRSVEGPGGLRSWPSERAGLWRKNQLMTIYDRCAKERFKNVLSGLWPIFSDCVHGVVSAEVIETTVRPWTFEL